MSKVEKAFFGYELGTMEKLHPNLQTHKTNVKYLKQITQRQ